MSEARVDKRWKEKDLDGYSTEAIFGTLKHYGVTLSEDEFKKLAATSYPLTISWRWAETWKGTGQFSDFHAAAAQELWHRVRPGAFAPSDLAVPLINLLHAMHDVIDGKKDDGTRETRFTIVEAYLAKLPTEPEARAEFEHEAYVLLGDDWREVFDAMAEALAEEKHLALAQRFARLEETLFPVRAGVAQALVRAASGEKDAAAADLKALGNDAARSLEQGVSTLGGLVDLERFDDAAELMQRLVDRSLAEKNVDVLGDLTERASEVLEGASPEKRKPLVAALERGLDLVSQLRA